MRRAARGAPVIPIRAGAAAAACPTISRAGPIVVLGLCGALRGLRAGAVVLYRDAVDERGRFAFDGELVRAMHATLPFATLVNACTADHVVTRATERAALAAAYSADVVDMETTHVARALALRGRARAAVRVVSDDASYDLPPIADAIDAAGSIRPLHLTRAFARHPRAAARFVRDVRRALAVLAETARTLSRTG